MRMNSKTELPTIKPGRERFSESVGTALGISFTRSVLGLLHLDLGAVVTLDG